MEVLQLKCTTYSTSSAPPELDKWLSGAVISGLALLNKLKRLQSCRKRIYLKLIMSTTKSDVATDGDGVNSLTPPTKSRLPVPLLRLLAHRAPLTPKRVTWKSLGRKVDPTDLSLRPTQFKSKTTRRCGKNLLTAQATLRHPTTT